MVRTLLPDSQRPRVDSLIGHSFLFVQYLSFVQGLNATPCARRDANATGAFFDKYKPTHVIQLAALGKSYGTCGRWKDVTYTGTTVGGLFKNMKHKVRREHSLIVPLMVPLIISLMHLDNSSPSSATIL